MWGVVTMHKHVNGQGWQRDSTYLCGAILGKPVVDGADLLVVEAFFVAEKGQLDAVGFSAQNVDAFGIIVAGTFGHLDALEASCLREALSTSYLTKLWVSDCQAALVDVVEPGPWTIERA